MTIIFPTKTTATRREYNEIRIARLAISDAIAAIRLRLTGNANAHLQQLLSELSRKSRELNIHYAAIKGQSHRIFETLPYDDTMQIGYLEETLELNTGIVSKDPQTNILLEIMASGIERHIDKIQNPLESDLPYATHINFYQVDEDIRFELASLILDHYNIEYNVDELVEFRNVEGDFEYYIGEVHQVTIKYNFPLLSL